MINVTELIESLPAGHAEVVLQRFFDRFLHQNITMNEPYVIEGEPFTISDLQNFAEIAKYEYFYTFDIQPFIPMFNEYDFYHFGRYFLVNSDQDLSETSFTVVRNRLANYVQKPWKCYYYHFFKQCTNIPKLCKRIVHVIHKYN